MKTILRHRARSGFTVLEILVASALMVVIVGMVLGLTSSVLRSWTVGTATLGRDAQLQQAYQLIQHDFESAVVTPDARPWLYLEADEDGFSMNWLGPARGQSGLEQVEWALRRRDARGREIAGQWSLFRVAVPVSREPLAEAPSVDVFDNEGQWWRAFVLGDVIDWEWEGFTRDAEGQLQSLVQAGVDLMPTGGILTFPLQKGDDAWQAPDVWEIRLRVLSADAARQYERMTAEGLPAETLSAFLAREQVAVTWRLTRPYSR